MIEDNQVIKANKQALKEDKDIRKARLDKYIANNEKKSRCEVYQVLDAWSLMVVYEAINKADVTRWLGRDKGSQVTSTTFDKQRLVKNNHNGKYYFLDVMYVEEEEYEEMVENTKKYGVLCLD